MVGWSRALSRGCALLVACGVCLTAGCGPATSAARIRKAQSRPQVIFLNFKPEATAALKRLAKAYHKKTGTKVVVTTPEEGKYDETLHDQLTRPVPPTIFQISGPTDARRWGDYLASFDSSAVYRNLTDKSLALRQGRSVVAVPYSIESYGIVYNKTILEKYFALPDAAVKSVAQVTDFDTLKALADDLQKHRQQLGIAGAFSSAGLAADSSWRYTNHLANYPLVCELGPDADSRVVSSVTGACLDGYKAVMDLYLSDSTVPAAQTANRGLTDSIREFAGGQAAMIQEGTWSWPQLKAAGADARNVGMMPIRMTGVGGDTGPGKGLTGYAVGSESFWSVNKQASKVDQKASFAFLNWLVTAPEAQKALVGGLGMAMPFASTRSLATGNPLEAAARGTGQGASAEADEEGHGQKSENKENEKSRNDAGDAGDTGSGSAADGKAKGKTGEKEDGQSAGARDAEGDAGSVQTVPPAGKAVPWVFELIPSAKWQSGLRKALQDYVQTGGPDGGNWEAVKSAFVAGWAQEYQDALGN